MAEEVTKTKGGIWFLIILIIIIYLIWAYNQNCCGELKTTGCGCDPLTDRISEFLHNLLNPKKSSSSYQKCIDANKALSDGSDCQNCVEEGSNIASFGGVIKNGECIQKSSLPTEQIKGQVQVVNQNGTYIFIKDETLNDLKPTNQIIPFGSKINYIDVVNSSYCNGISGQCFPPVDFYKMINGQGFLISKDVMTLNSPE